MQFQTEGLIKVVRSRFTAAKQNQNKAGQMKNPEFQAVKVFSATMVKDREVLGEKVTEWMKSIRNLKIMDYTVTQSSDNAFHCVTITIFYRVG